MTLDGKQQQLISAWLERAAKGDEYGRFMAAWIAFNALCYALFAERASKSRPNLSDGRGLEGLTKQVPVEGTLEPRPDQGARLKIERPGRIRIDFRDRYVEDVIFREFAKEYADAFARSWLREPAMSRSLDEFLDSVKQARGHYVINMLKVQHHNEWASLDELVRKGVVAAVAKREELAQLVDALYQVRCSVFHGEKVPGVPNDDRIVRAARPLLIELIQHVLAGLR